MNDELQTDAPEESGITLDNIESEETNLEALETDKGGAELAPATEDKQDKSDDGVQKAINKQHAKYREEERLKLAEQEENKKLREKLAAFEAEKKDVIIPDIPDSWDEDYEEKIKLRDEAIKRQATQDAQNSVALEQQNAQKEAANKAEQERVSKSIEGYTARIVPLGLSPEEMKIAGNKVIEYGITSELAEHILKQEDGPLITKYLSENPIELDNLRNMSVIEGAMRINSEIKAAASTLKPQASLTPDPAETLNGRGVGEQKSPLLKGVTFT